MTLPTSTAPADQSAFPPILFAVPGDLHLTNAAQKNYRTALWAIGEINTVVRPDFVQFIGDNAQEAAPAQFALFQALRARVEAPSDVLVGDHDVHEDPQAAAFQRFVGETYGARTFPGARFLRLNTQQAKPLGLSAKQVAWFGAQVDAALALGEQVVVFQHNYPFQIWEDFAGPGIDEWRGIVQTRRLAAIVCGHTHYFQEANDGRNVAVAVRAIGDPEGGAPGYLVGCLHGEDLAFTYRTVHDIGPVVLVAHPRDALLATGPCHVVSGDDQIRVWARSASAVVSVQARVNRDEWQILERTEDSHWAGGLSAAGLAKGAHRLEVEAQDESGQIGRRAQEFVVDHTGRYTAVPAVRPLVTQTQFC